MPFVCSGVVTRIPHPRSIPFDIQGQTHTTAKWVRTPRSASCLSLSESVSMLTHFYVPEITSHIGRHLSRWHDWAHNVYVYCIASRYIPFLPYRPTT